MTCSRPLARSTSTSLTPASSVTSSVTEATQCWQVMPVTVKSRVCTVLLSRSGRASGTDEPGDGGRRLGDLGVGGGPVVVGTAGDRIADAVAQVVVEQAESHRLQGLGGRGDLGEDVDAVGVVLDHPRDAAHLTLDPLESSEDLVLVAGVARHALTIPLGGTAYQPRVPGSPLNGPTTSAVIQPP